MLLEKHGFSVGPTAIGCEQLGGTDWGKVNHEEVARAIKLAWDYGIRVFDTADVYGLGASEEHLARTLGSFRHEATIITKGGIRWSESKNGDGRAETARDSSPIYIKSAVENSLRRLRLDVLPIYLIHWPDPATPLHATLEALEELKSQGKILTYGLSNFAKEVFETAGGHVEVCEFEFNLLNRNAADEMSEKTEIFKLGYGTLAQGLLSGKYSPDDKFGRDDRRHRLPHFGNDSWKKNARVLALLNDISAKNGLSMAQVAIAWTIKSNLVDTSIIGVKSRTHVEELFAKQTFRLSKEDFEMLSSAIS